jgi:glycosyltransferase involved in cell wall biosynthesis
MIIRPASIIVCTHNRAELLSEIVNQLCAQDYPQDSFEIIVVDNCSIDDTPQIVQRLIPNREVTLRYVRENRPGVTFARNRGAEESCYPYLAYLDDDCSIESDWLSQLMSGFELDEHVSVVAGRVALDYDNQKIPTWLGSESERWLGKYNFPGLQPRLLDNPGYVCEGNMAIKRQAWEAAGGFLGIDQFSSPHMAAQEIIYLLEQIKRKGGKVAFVPKAAANHHTVIPSWQRMLMRSYWHGVSDGILDYLLHRFSWTSVIFHSALDMTAMFIFLGLALFFLLVFDKATALYHLLRAAARFGKILSELRLVGDWHRVRLWITANSDAR